MPGHPGALSDGAGSQGFKDFMGDRPASVIRVHDPTCDSIMSGLEILGFVAAILTTVCWLPQAFRTLRTKDTKSLSLVTQSAFTLGVGLWLIYGILAGNAPIIFANSVTFVLVASILAMKLRYG
jgi:MtN3 and saliva related transmembrane protein